MARRKRITIHIAVAIIATLCLMICCGIVSVKEPRSRKPQFESTTFPLLSISNRINVSDCLDVRFSRYSGHFLILRQDAADIYSPRGVKLYSAAIIPGSKAVLSAQGDYVLSFRERNPSDTSVEIFDSTGSKVREIRVDGAVWSADSCIHDKGARFIIGTGKGYVYVVDLAGKGYRYRRWRVPGVVVSLAADPEGQSIYVAGWQSAFIRRISLTGRTYWQVDMEQAHLHRVKPLVAADGVFVYSEPLGRKKDGGYKILNSNGEILMSARSPLDEKTRITVAPNGRFVCLGLTKTIRHKNAYLVERHAKLFGQSEGVLWEKGSSFFSAVPIAVTENGFSIISDGKAGIFIISPLGEMRSSLRLTSPAREFFASDDSSRLLAHCFDRRLFLINVTK